MINTAKTHLTATRMVNLIDRFEPGSRERVMASRIVDISSQTRSTATLEAGTCVPYPLSITRDLFGFANTSSSSLISTPLSWRASI